jgi:hypothetical protein
MIYYRLASQKRASTEWEWKSSVLSSLEAVFRLRQRYNMIPAERLCVFLASSTVYMDILLVRENLGLPSNSLTMDQLLHEHSSITAARIRSFETELGWSEEKIQAEARQTVPVAAQESRQAQSARPVSVLDQEPGGGDHDVPYTFSFPPLLPQVRAWMRLRERVLAGELVS